MMRAKVSGMVEMLKLVVALKARSLKEDLIIHKYNRGSGGCMKGLIVTRIIQHLAFNVIIILQASHKSPVFYP